MYYDYWHLRRQLRLQGSGPEDFLPFGAPPIVIGDVVSFPEPIWRTATTTAVKRGAPQVFASWRWESPLSTSDANRLLISLRSLMTDVQRERIILHPQDTSEADQPDVDSVLIALDAIEKLLSLAIEQNCAIETWVE